ncbi:MAG: PD-(D/E)XK nuclease family protein, partial [Cyclobacteriaceae bacterium]
ANRPWVEKTEQRLYWEAELLRESSLYSLLFSHPEDGFVVYLIRILEELSILIGQEDAMTTAHIHYYLKHLYRYQDLVDKEIGVDTFRRLFHQLVRMDKIPFTGEPLEGLQIMGVLETRNLDFDRVFVLGMNEESFPGGRNKHSYVPYNLRKAYELPHYDQQDAIYAYLFYRLLHNSSSVTYFYNTEGDQLGGEEMSRFLKQLIYERPFEVKHHLLRNIACVNDSPEINPVQDERSLHRLQMKFEAPDAASRITPSALNVYLDCRLKFYFRYITGLYEQEELEDNVDARTLGNLIHFSVEQLYTPFLHKEVQPADVIRLEKKIPEAIEGAFRKMYHIKPEESFAIEGKNVIADGVAQKYLKKILEKDKLYAPFKVIGLEVLMNHDVELSDGRKVRCGGYVDRVDQKGDKVRIVDFKSGKDSAEFKGTDSLFKRNEKNRNKAAFQTFFYSSMYYPEEIGLDVVPVVYNRNVLFQDADEHFWDSSWEGKVDRFGPYRDQYRKSLVSLLDEIFASDNTFPQTDDLDKCRYCPYNVICQRV